jgi:hypothetical protein
MTWSGPYARFFLPADAISVGASLFKRQRGSAASQAATSLDSHLH